MARVAGVDPKRFRALLRKEAFSWHSHNSAWTVEIGSDRHRQMLAVLDRLKSGRLSRAQPMQAKRTTAVSDGGRRASDETYILDLCDAILGVPALRQHCFDFLRGDPGVRGIGKRLPVDAWYPTLNLVVEYRERQHVEPVALFDRKATVSGVGRGEQRAIYDQRRRDVFDARGIRLVELNLADFVHNGSKRLLRVLDDRIVVETSLLG
jgi:hypothetical protein